LLDADAPGGKVAASIAALEIAAAKTIQLP